MFLSECASVIFEEKDLCSLDALPTRVRPALWIVDDLLSFENCPREVVNLWGGPKMDRLPDSRLKDRVLFLAYAHPNCPEELLEIGAVDPNFCAAVANNVNCPTRTRLVASVINPTRTKAPWARLRTVRMWG